MLRVQTWLCLCVAFFSHCHLLGEKKIEPRFKAQAEVDIKIDGQLDEPEWKEAAVVNDFIKAYPEEKTTKPSLETEVRLFYTNQGLYIGFFCQQEPGKSISRLSNRDNNNVERDWFRVSLDPTGKGSQGYFMELALGGSLRDGTILAERNFNRDWDGAWYGDTILQETGWSGEIFVPWNMFSIPKVDDVEHEMGIHLERWVSHAGERHSWEPIYDQDSRFLSGFSKIKVKITKRSSPLVLVPYGAGNLDQLNSSSKGKGGMDLFWNPRAEFKLSATAFPDFGQVESDDLVVNLGAFETFFPEKRSFFLEDRDVFNTKKYNLVHTRRIGASADLAEDPNGFQAQNAGGATDIITATKTTGLWGPYQYAAMVAVEEDTDLLWTNPDTGQSEIRTTAGRKYYTGRLKRETTTGAGHYLAHGWLGTLTDRAALNREAMVNAYDGALRDRDGKWRLNWQALSSRIEENGQSESGFGAWIDGNFQTEKGWNHYMELVYFDEKIDINDLGFLWRNDQQWVTYNLSRSQTEIPGLQEREVNIRTAWARNKAGELIQGRSSFWVGWTRESRARWGFNVDLNPKYWDDRVSRGNGSIRRSAGAETGINRTSDPRKKLGIYTGLWFWNQEEMDQRPSYLVRMNFRYTPNDHLDFRFNNAFRNRDGWLLWREDTTFAAYDALQYEPNIRADVLISPSQDIRLIAQWVAIKAETQSVLQLGNNGELAEVEGADLTQEDFEIGTTAIQVRYRYEFSPLSEIFVVYSLGGNVGEDTGGEPRGINQLLSGGLDDKFADQFLAKVRYRF